MWANLDCGLRFGGWRSRSLTRPFSNLLHRVPSVLKIHPRYITFTSQVRYTPPLSMPEENQEAIPDLLGETFCEDVNA